MPEPALVGAIPIADAMPEPALAGAIPIADAPGSSSDPMPVAVAVDPVEEKMDSDEENRATERKLMAAKYLLRPPCRMAGKFLIGKLFQRGKRLHWLRQD